MRRQEMHNTRGRSKKRAEDTEKEEGGDEQEIEVVTDSEMEQPLRITQAFFLLFSSM